MAGEGDKKVSRLFLVRAGAKKRGTGGRSASKSEFRPNPVLIRLCLLIFVAAVTVLLLLPPSPNHETRLRIGDIADRDIKAARELMVLDRTATIEKRQAVSRNSPAVFDLDDQAAQRAGVRIHELFSKGREIISAPPVSRPVFTSLDSVRKPDRWLMTRLEKRFRLTFNLDPEEKSFQALALTGFSPRMERAILKLVMDLLDHGVVSERRVLLEQPQTGIMVRRVYSQQENLVQYYQTFSSLEDARRIIVERAILYRDDFKPGQLKAMVAVAQSLIEPNLTINQRETDARRQSAIRQVAPVFFQVKKDEMIVREGERVDELACLKLEAQASRAGRTNWLSQAGGVSFLVALFLLVTCLVGFRAARSGPLSDRDLLFLTTLLTLSLMLAFAASQVGSAMERGWNGLDRTTILYLTPVAGGGMLAAVFLGLIPGFIFSMIASALTALLLDHSLSLFFYYFLGSVAGLAGVAKVRERGAVIKAGVLISLINMGTVVSLGLQGQTFFTRGTLFDLGAGALCGFLAGIMVTGLVPFFEMIFRYTTNIKLLELANLDRPVLRELMLQAPGTYHHSVIVGAMVEAAAEAIGANPLLAKVSAYYHDLGKMKKPLYFVENQGTGQNKHEKLAPSMSSLILISHVKEGVELARKNGLSPEIIDIIQQHHGTSLIAYFYQKAKDSRAPDQPEINIEDYRYPGPKPQTREAGLVMLADVVEAASRTLADPAPARIQGLVQKLINNIFSDGQLDECELTLKDLHLIARSFNNILTGIYHRRIDYPEPAAKNGDSRNATVNGNQNKQSAKGQPDSKRQDRVPGKENLKRLGLS